jgi:glycosyltransferase involved in cell wall biosynthesis
MVSLCLTNYNRYELLINSFIGLVDDDRVSEVVISDDCSDPAIYKLVEDRIKDWPKVKLFRNAVNLDCYRNKREAVSKATNEWVILADSDNVFTKRYVDSLYARESIYPFSRHEILTPSFARPHFDFHRYIGYNITKESVGYSMEESTFQTMLNACNYFVNRDEYLKVWDGSVNPVTSDSIFMAYNWLKAGNSIYVVPGLEYEHRVDNHGKEERSHYAKNVRSTPRGFHEDIINKLKAMR